MRIPALLLLLCAFGCATTSAPSIDLATAEVVDLTYAFDDKTLYWPNSPSGFESIQRKARASR